MLIKLAEIIDSGKLQRGLADETFNVEKVGKAHGRLANNKLLKEVPFNTCGRAPFIVSCRRG